MVLAIVLAAFGLLSQPVAAGANPVPDLVAYQGRVYLGDGSTDVNGTYDIEFRLYDAAREGALLWAEGHANVPVARGMFSVLLGAGAEVEIDATPLPHGSLRDVFRLDEVYVQLQIGTGEEFRSVRRRFVATPHALRVQNAVTAVHGVPPGTVMPFAGGTAPYGWLPCEGASYAQSQYPDLYAAIGVTWGGGDDPPNTFNVPNLGGRIPVGAVNADSARELGDTEGEEKHTLTTAEMPRHKHEFLDKRYDGATYVGGPFLGDFNIADDVDTYTPETTGSTGGGQPHNTIQPSAVVKYVIKY